MNDNKGTITQAKQLLSGPGRDDRKAYDFLSKIENDPEAQFLMSRMFIEGFPVDKDVDKATDLLRSSAEGGFLPAQEYLALHAGPYETIRIKDDEQLKWLRRAIEQGSIEAMFELGRRTFFGYGVPEDETKGIDLITKSADKGCEDAKKFLDAIEEKRMDKMPFPDLIKIAEGGNIAAQRTLGYRYYMDMDGNASPEKSFKWFLAAAKNGDAESMHQLATAYRRGQGTEQSNIQSIEWETKSAEAGYVPAMSALAMDYLRGYSVEQSYDKFVKYTAMAAEHGSAMCQLQLAEMYIAGTPFLEKSYPDAMKWYSAAAEQMEPDAIHNLAQMYLFGEGVEVDQKKAFDLFLLAADMGYDRSQSELGYMSLNGYGTQKSIERAVFWYSLAASKGNVNAMAWMGESLVLGRFVERDAEKGIGYLSAAAERGNAASALLLGKFYLEGDLVEKDQKKAEMWLELASKNGNADAKAILDSIRPPENEPTFMELVERADGGDAEAMYDVGERFLKGNGVEECPSTAIYYLANAAARGYTDSVLLLAEVYFRGAPGIRCDHRLAFMLYNRYVHMNSAVVNNMSHGRLGYVMMQLAIMHTYGLGTEKSGEKAFDLLLKLKDQKNPVGIRMMGEAYLSGFGVEKSRDKGIENLKLAIDMGDNYAPASLGDFYASEGDYAKAAEYYRTGTEMNDQVACCRLARLYEEGKGVDQSFASAKGLYESAAASKYGFGEAEYRLGMMHYEGMGTPESKEEAIKHFHRATQDRYPDAFYMMGVMFHNGEGVEKSDKDAKLYLDEMAKITQDPGLREKAKKLLDEIGKQ